MFNIRKNDVIKRKRKVDLIKEEIAIKEKEKEDRDNLYKEEYDKEKQQAEDDEKEFNEEEFNEKFNKNNKEVIIPEDMEYDIDNDFEFEEEAK